MTAIVELKNVTKSYQAEEVQTQALRGIELKIEQGDYIAITGPSGCGKSTLLNVLGLLDTVSSGTYTLAGHDVGALSFDQRADIRNKSIGFVFQSFLLLPNLSILENVSLPLTYARPQRPEFTERASELLERVGLGHRKSHKPSQLSGGQQQRAAIARALVMQPELLLLDEPTGNLDEETSESIMSLLDELNDKSTTIVLVTHEPEFARRAKKAVHIRDGRVQAEA